MSILQAYLVYNLSDIDFLVEIYFSQEFERTACSVVFYLPKFLLRNLNSLGPLKVLCCVFSLETCRTFSSNPVQCCGYWVEPFSVFPKGFLFSEKKCILIPDFTGI